jgi:signal transduction histidine kinase
LNLKKGTGDPAAVRIFDAGRSANLIGKTLMDMVHPDFRSMANERGDKTRDTGQVDVRELEMMTLDGESFPCEVAAVVIPREESEASFVMVRDITDRQEVDKLKTKFVSLVSHELRTLLTSIVVSIGLMKGGALGELPKPAFDILSLAKSNAERLTNFVNDIIDFEKLQSGGMEFSFTMSISST